MAQTQSYRVRDLGFAAYLLCEGYILLDSVLIDNAVYFIFEDLGLSIKDLESEYKYGNAKTSAKRMYENLRDLKHKIYELKGK